jgi:hypothetical protein
MVIVMCLSVNKVEVWLSQKLQMYASLLSAGQMNESENE